jgi:hypothetical protein
MRVYAAHATPHLAGNLKAVWSVDRGGAFARSHPGLAPVLATVASFAMMD